MAAIAFNAIRKAHLRTAVGTLRQLLDTFASRQMRRAAAQAGRRNRKHAHVPPAGHPNTPAVPFEPLDSSIVSDAIPAFFIGRNESGFWVAREATGRAGGLFLLKGSALAFAQAQGGPAGCATIFPQQGFELDLANEGNPLAASLAPFLRLAILCRRRTEKLLGPARSKDQAP